MKHVTTLLALVGAFACAAQPTFEYADFPTGTLEYEVYLMLDDGGTLEPTDGADQTWDHSAMTWLLAGTATSGPASATPYAADYPEVNIAWTIDPSVGATEYQYYALSPTGYEMVAIEVPGAPDVFTDFERTLQFPLSLGGSFSDTYTSTSGSGTVTWSFTGYGTFITAEGTFTDQIKMKNSVDDVVLWNASPIYPRFLVSSGNVFLFVATSTGVEDHHAGNVMRAFPSPCINDLTVEGLGAGRWWITDVLGRIVTSGNSNGPPVEHIDVAALSPGTYSLVKRGDPRPLRFVKDRSR